MMMMVQKAILRLSAFLFFHSQKRTTWGGFSLFSLILSILLPKREHLIEWQCLQTAKKQQDDYCDGISELLKLCRMNF